MAAVATSVAAKLSGPACKASPTEVLQRPASSAVALSRTALSVPLSVRVAHRACCRRGPAVRLAVATASDSSASASDDSVVPEVDALEDEADTVGVATKRKPSPLARGGTLAGTAAAGKAPAASTVGSKSTASFEGKFTDPRWVSGTWDLAQFTADGKTDWDAVIDAEVVRRKWLEENPESSTNEDPVLFESGTIPWWAWTRRFHLPEAELLNGRAAMVGFAATYVVDLATGAGLVDQMGSFFGKLLLLITVVGTLLIRKNEDLVELKKLTEEWTFYDKQWQATWKEGPPPSESKKE